MVDYTATAAVAEAGLGGMGGAVVPNSLMYPGLSQLIVEYAMPAQIFRQMFQHYAAPGKQSVTIPKEDTPANSAAIVVSRMGEGDEFPLNFLSVTSSTVTVYKVGEGYQVTNEMLMFQQVPIIQQRLKRLGYTIGNTIDFDCAAVVDAGGVTNGSTAVAGKTKGMDNTVAAEANTIGQYDIVDATVRMLNNNLFSDSIIVNPKGAGYIKKLPQFSALQNYGTPRYAHGELGEVEGLRVLVSRHTGAQAAHTVTDGIAYVLGGTQSDTPNPLGQYTPMGYFIESLPITTITHDNPRRDAYEVYAKAMIAPVVTLTTAIERLDSATA